MGSFEEGSLLAVTDCYHVYHANCFQPWCAIHGKCPYCREPLIAYFNLIDSPSYRLPIQHYQ